MSSVRELELMFLMIMIDLQIDSRLTTVLIERKRLWLHRFANTAALTLCMALSDYTRANDRCA
jgi:hypothetical protein